MHCENCDAAVETEVVRDADWEHYQGWFESDDVETREAQGVEHGVDDIGERFGDNPEYEVFLRVDICANCAVPICSRIFTKFV